MKYYLFLLFCCINLFLFGQKLKGDLLYFEDTLVNGHLKFVGNSKVHFYAYGAAKNIRIPNRIVDSIIVTNKLGKKSQYYPVLLKSAKGKPFVTVKDCLVRGAVSLYYSPRIYLSNVSNGGFGSGFGSGFGVMTEESYDLYIVTPATLFAKNVSTHGFFSRRKFIPWAKDIFADCTEVIDSIALIKKPDIYTDLIRLAKLYNQHCSPKQEP